MNLVWILLSIIILILGFLLRNYLEKKEPWYCDLTCWKKDGEWYRGGWGRTEKLGKYKNDPTDGDGKITL